MELYIFKKLYYYCSIKLQNKMDTNSTCFLPLSSMIHSFTVTDSLVLISLGIPLPRCSQDGNTIGDPVPVWNAIRNRTVEWNGRSAFPFRKTRIWNGRAVPETKKCGTVAFLGNFAVRKQRSEWNGPLPFPK